MLAIRLCVLEQNREYLKDKPFTPCGELAAVYRIQVMESKEGCCLCCCYRSYDGIVGCY